MTPIWDDRATGWVAHKIWGEGSSFDNARGMAVVSKDAVVAGLVFHNWEPNAGVIEVSAAASDRRWLTRRVATEAMAYAFDGCGCQMVIARHSEQNRAARKIWVALGATETLIPRLYGRNENGIVATLTQEAWRASKFNEVNHGKIKGSGPA